MLKPRLTKVVEEIFAIGGNHDSAKDMELREELLNFLREEDHLMLPAADANLMLAKDMIRFIDADKIYAQTTDGKQAYPHVKLFLERMTELDLNKWHYYELKLLISSINFTEDIKQAMELASKAEKRIFLFKRIRRTEMLEGALAGNMCTRLLCAKYFDNDVKIDLVTSEFQVWFRRFEKLTAENQSDNILSLMFLATKIRKALFERHSTSAYQLCEELETYYDAGITKAINNEVHFYTTSKEYNNFETKQGGDL